MTEALCCDAEPAGSSVYLKAAAVKTGCLPLEFDLVLMVRGATVRLVNMVNADSLPGRDRHIIRRLQGEGMKSVENK